MSKNTGIPYEILTQQIFQALNTQKLVKTLDIQHNVELQGITAKHQIDVYWEFEVGGVAYRTIVQTKDWTQPVKQEHLFAFRTILDDIPGQPRGVYVTSTGFQRGAVEFAKAHGILLYELREPTAEDMEGKVMTFQLKISVFAPKSSNIVPIFDEPWVLAERQRQGLGADEVIKIQAGGFENQLFLLNEAGEKTGTFHSVIQSMFPPAYTELPATAKEHTFTAPTYMLTGNDRFPRMKLLGLRATISVQREDQELILKGEDFIGFVLHDVIGDKTTMIDKQNRPIK